MISYTVTITFDDAALAGAWKRWLLEQHMRDVCAAGARDAELLEIDPSREGETILEVRYHFDSREAFAAYERDHAPRLRAEGLARVPAGANVQFRRAIGVIAGRV